MLIAVADGLGSVAHADVGARRAVDAAIAAMRSALRATGRGPRRSSWRQARGAVVVRGAFSAARRALEDEARVRCTPLSALATTLLVVLVTADGTATIGQLGDGAVVTIAPNGAPRRPLPPTDTGAVNVVTPVTHPAALRSVRVATAAGVDALAVSTDGLDAFITADSGGTPHAPFVLPVLRFAAASADASEASRQLTAWLACPRVTAGTDDDCTLLLAVRRGARL